MVEALLPCQIRVITASCTQALRQRVLRPDLTSVPYRGDDLDSTAHFGAFVNDELVGVASAFHEPLVPPSAVRSATLRQKLEPGPRSKPEPSREVKPQVDAQPVSQSEVTSNGGWRTKPTTPSESGVSPELSATRTIGTDTKPDSTWDLNPDPNVDQEQPASSDTAPQSELGMNCRPAKKPSEDFDRISTSDLGFQQERIQEMHSRPHSKGTLDTNSRQRPDHEPELNSNPDPAEQSESNSKRDPCPEIGPLPKSPVKKDRRDSPAGEVAPDVLSAFNVASDANSWRIRGLAVDLPVRGKGLGSRLISACIQHAREQQANCVWCVARCSAEPVYEKMGFQGAGDVFHLEGIGHVRYMIRGLL